MGKFKYIAVLGLLLLIPNKSFAALAYDTDGNCGGGGSTYSCTTNSIASGASLTAMVIGDVGGSMGTVSCTYNGTSMGHATFAAVIGDRSIYGFELDNVTGGANTLACTGNTFEQILYGSYTGGQYNSSDNLAVSAAIAIASTISANASTDLVAAWGYPANGSITSGIGVVSVRGSTFGGGRLLDGSAGGSGSQTYGYNYSTLATSGLLGYDLKIAGGPPPPPPSNMDFLSLASSSVPSFTEVVGFKFYDAVIYAQSLIQLWVGSPLDVLYRQNSWIAVFLVLALVIYFVLRVLATVRI